MPEAAAKPLLLLVDGHAMRDLQVLGQPPAPR